MRYAILIAVLGLLAGASSAAAEGRLVVSGAVADADQRVLRLSVHCAGGCAGVLRVSALGRPVTARRRIAVSTRPLRLRLRLLAGGFTALGNDALEAEVALGRRRVRFAVRLRVRCSSDSTLGRSAVVRAFRLVGVGVYACERPAGRPLLIASESADVVVTAADHVTVAGHFVALARTVAFKCESTQILVADVRARRVVRRRGGSTITDTEGVCRGTGAVGAIVLRDSGALAWTETPGDAHETVVRALDDAGDRELDRGGAVDAFSLVSIGDATIGWRRGAALQTAPLR